MKQTNVADDLRTNYDFAGWVTYHDIKCSDGAVIKSDAFAHQDGQIVSVSWNHKGKEDPRNIFGKMLLEHRDEGMYGYAQFNDTDRGQHSKEMVIHGDINAMSIGANKIIRDPLNPSNVIGGNIYEVSLVQSGANPMATIEEVVTHDDEFDGSHIIFENGLFITNAIEHSKVNGESNKMSLFDTLEHGDKGEILEHAEDLLNGLTEEEQAAVAVLVEEASTAAADAREQAIMESEEIQDLVEAAELLEEIVSDLNDEDDDESEGDDDNTEFDDVVEQSHKAGGQIEHMRKNLFQEGTIEHSYEQSKSKEYYKQLILEAQNEIKHSDITLRDYITDMKATDAERASILEHSLNNVELLFPDYTTVNGVQFVFSKNTATEEIMSGLSKYPTGFVRTLAADLSDMNDKDLRANGYIKGNQKKEQIFGFIERKTTAQTIYKKQSIDRDDQIDMSKNLDIQMVYRTEMKSKINDEVARAVLVGDGREIGSVDKIKEDRIRPIISDDDFFTLKGFFNNTDLTTLSETIDLAMIDLKGSGTPAMILSPRLVTKIRHLKDKDGLFLYGGRTPASLKDLADLFGVSKIIKSEFLADDDIIIVNLADYGLGHEKGGELSSYEQFDIHVNKTYFLMEVRLAGALVRPHSALYLKGTKDGKKPQGKASGPEEGVGG